VIDAPPLRVSEILGLAYFVYLSIAAIVVRLPATRRAFVWIAAVSVVAAELALARPSGWAAQTARDWLPALVILLAYFVTGAFFVAPSPRFEAWLRQWDERLVGRAPFESVPAPVALYLDVVYDACFLMIPAGFATYMWSGSGSADRFWTMVAAAEFLSFGTLPWLQARPPWVIEGRRDADRTGVRRFSLFWVDRTSIHANTFPSGHASASLAVALALLPVAPVAAAVFGVLAVSIAIGSVVGRFHYAIDAVAGLLLAAMIWWTMIVIGL
jgi:membrane-associated phospholipid phosphatase